MGNAQAKLANDQRKVRQDTFAEHRSEGRGNTVLNTEEATWTFASERLGPVSRMKLFLSKFH